MRSMLLYASDLGKLVDDLPAAFKNPATIDLKELPSSESLVHDLHFWNATSGSRNHQGKIYADADASVNAGAASHCTRRATESLIE
ncbi:hypothetical protein [Parachryseolinea silvisoli]|uniref:hypothetical protein n=1 Tax=Parachryseolinea silvisoli TaxID=2873601 RepID=UPI002265EC21|nr:hypothetical protein [Parachryseolinea silvisoli]MCD9015174.1 hypothetical protein [Parachryseolinea silvisoli]